MIKDNVAVVQRYKDDKKVAIPFDQIIDAEGEVIKADVYYISAGFVANVNADGFQALGGKKGERKEVVCDFSALEVSDGYSLKFYTEESGVLAKAGLVIFAEDAFSTKNLSGEIPDPIIPDTDPVQWDEIKGKFDQQERNDAALTFTDKTVYVFTGTTGDWTLSADRNFHCIINAGSGLLRLHGFGTDPIFQSDPYLLWPGDRVWAIWTASKGWIMK